MASLLALFGPKRGVRVDLADGGALTVGRSSACDLQLIDEKVSREHCRFTIEAGEAKVEDLGSNNGTWVNGAKIGGRTRLTKGDEIAVGDSLFVLDGELDVAAARFGEETLIVAPGAESKRREGVGGGGVPRAMQQVAAAGAALARAASREEAARALLAAIEGAVPCDRAFVLLWDPARKIATPIVGKSEGAAVTISRTVIDAAVAAKKAVVFDDAVGDRSLKDAKSVVRHGLRSVVVAPIVAQPVRLRAGGGPGARPLETEAEVVGLLHVDRKTAGSFDGDDVAALEALASVAALSGLGGAARAEVAAPKRRVPASERPVAESRAMREALRIAEAAAPAGSTVLITGDSGTGKEEIARFVHEASPRAGKAFVAVNCGAIPEALAESELFGHEKGAFTGAIGSAIGKVEAADGGTLFLDEIGELAPAVQVKLLRVLQERAFYRVGSTTPRRVDLRVVAATHRRLEDDVKTGRFREDLYYRLNVIRVALPPLRERPEDVEPLARALLGRVCATLGRRDPGLSPEAIKALAGHAWPGNARELANVLERMVVLRAPGATEPLTRAEAIAAIGGGGAGGVDSANTLSGTTLAEKVASLEKQEVERALKAARGVKARAAEILGISRPTLDKKIADLGIDLWKEAAAD